MNDRYIDFERKLKEHLCEKDHRRLAEKKYNWIHPCISFPKEDVSIEVFPFIDIQA